jgi:uncharacterized membrane protein (UPF0127 family)
MSIEMDLLKHAIASRQSYSQVLSMHMEQANTVGEKNKGLIGSDGETAMTFNNSSGDFTTKNMSHNLNITKQDHDGNIVQSYRAVPPGIDNLPMGDNVGTVIETPATYKEPKINDWFINSNTTSYDESQNYQRIKGSRKGVRENPDGSHSTHLMADNNKDEAWPTLFQKEDGSWYEGGYDEAKRRDEIYKFDSKEELIKFARKGDWKDTYKEPCINNWYMKKGKK